jgi:hypothetical protein
MLRYLIAVFLGLAHLVQAVGDANAAQDDASRYNEIRRAIRARRHLSAHMVMAVDARTIKAVRKRITEQDIPVLVQMMGDKNYGVASAASGLLVTLGEKAAPALRNATHSTNSSIASQAQDALSLLERCYSNPQGTNPDVCPPARVPQKQ